MLLSKGEVHDCFQDWLKRLFVHSVVVSQLVSQRDSVGAKGGAHVSEGGWQKVKNGQNDGCVDLKILEQHNEGEGTVVFLEQLPDVCPVLLLKSK